MSSTIEFSIIPNRKNMEGKHPELFVCERCGCKSNAYTIISKIIDNDLENNIILCKGCLLEAIQIIDTELLNQAKTRIG